MVPELIPVLGSQPAGDRSHKPGGVLANLNPLMINTARVLFSRQNMVSSVAKDLW